MKTINVSIDAPKLAAVVTDLVTTTPRHYSNSQTVAIGEIEGRVVVLTVMSESFAREDDIKINPTFVCVGNSEPVTDQDPKPSELKNAERKNWTTKDWMTHVGAWETERGTIEFGSVMAVGAMLTQLAQCLASQAQPSAPEGDLKS